MSIAKLKASYEKDGTLLRHAMRNQDVVGHKEAIADALIAAGNLVTRRKGAVLYTQGSQFGGVYFLLAGRIALTRDDVRLIEVEAEHELGTWPLLFSNSTYAVTAIATSDSVLLCVSRDGFRKVADKHPGLWERIAKNQASRVQLLNEDFKKRSAGDCDVLFVAALREEASFYKKRLAEFQHMKDVAIPHYRGVIQGQNGPLVARIVVQQLMGGIEAASLTTRAIQMMRPRLVVMTGIMGGFGQQWVALGDVIIAQEAFDYGFGKVTKSKALKKSEFLRDPRFVAIDTKLAEKINAWLVGDTNENRSGHMADVRRTFFRKKRASPAVSPTFGSQIHFGPVASGSLVVASMEKIAEIRNIHRHTYGVEMEIAGLLHAARECGVPAIAIKGVSDLADHNKDRGRSPDATHARAFAAFASMEVACTLLEQGIVP